MFDISLYINQYKLEHQCITIKFGIFPPSIACICLCSLYREAEIVLQRLIIKISSY